MDIQVHAKNWRPQLLVVAKANVSESSETGRECVNVENPDLLKFVSQLKGGRGFVIVGGICCNGAYENYIEGAGMFSGMEKFMASDGQEAMQKLLNDYGISGFGKVIYTHDFQEGLMGLVQNAGLGSFQPNSVITSWPPNWRNQTKEGELARTHLIRLVQASCAFNKMTLIPKGRLWPNSLVRLGGFIDIWWIVGEGGILLLLPFLLKKHQTWRDCRTRLWVLADKVGDDPEKVKSELKHYVTEFRLDIEVLVKIVDEKEIDFGGESLGRSNSFAAAAEQRKPLSPWDVEVGELHFDTTELVRTMSGMSREEMSEGDNFDAAAHAAPARALSRYMEGMARTAAVNKKSGFLHSKDQLTSTKPMSQEDLMIPRGLNKLILSESKEAELVVTNLPDMSKSESAFGYFQFVDAMTKGLPRVVLVRGTSSEVITAFT
jgi:potassium/chloride transporter 4/5/6